MEGAHVPTIFSGVKSLEKLLELKSAGIIPFLIKAARNNLGII